MSEFVIGIIAFLTLGKQCRLQKLPFAVALAQHMPFQSVPAVGGIAQAVFADSVFGKPPLR